MRLLVIIGAASAFVHHPHAPVRAPPPRAARDTLARADECAVLLDGDGDECSADELRFVGLAHAAQVPSQLVTLVRQQRMGAPTAFVALGRDGDAVAQTLKRGLGIDGDSMPDIAARGRIATRNGCNFSILRGPALGAH